MKEEQLPLQKGRQPPLPPGPLGKARGPAAASLESSNSNTGPVAKRGRVGPRATSSPPVPAGTKIVGGEKKEKGKKKKRKPLQKGECG